MGFKHTHKTHGRTYVRARTYTHARTHARTHTHAHTHTYTRARAPQQQIKHTKQTIRTKNKQNNNKNNNKRSHSHKSHAYDDPFSSAPPLHLSHPPPSENCRWDGRRTGGSGFPLAWLATLLNGVPVAWAVPHNGGSFLTGFPCGLFVGFLLQLLLSRSILLFPLLLSFFFLSFSVLFYFPSFCLSFIHFVCS